MLAAPCMADALSSAAGLQWEHFDHFEWLPPAVQLREPSPSTSERDELCLLHWSALGKGGAAADPHAYMCGPWPGQQHRQQGGSGGDVGDLPPSLAMQQQHANGAAFAGLNVDFPQPPQQPHVSGAAAGDSRFNSEQQQLQLQQQQQRQQHQQPQQLQQQQQKRGRSRAGKGATTTTAAVAAVTAAPDVKSKTALDAVKRLKQLAEEKRRAEEENARLKLRARTLSAFLQQVESDLEQRQQQQRQVERPLSRPCALPESCSQVSFASIPRPSLWDEAMVERVRRLTTVDLLVLRRQWLRESAMLLPKAEALGPESPDALQLLEMHGKQQALARSFVALIPGEWLRMSSYDLETLQPMEAPSTQWIAFRIDHIFSPGHVEPARRVAQEHRAAVRALQCEFERLQCQHQAQAAEMAACGAPGSPGYDGALARLDATAQLIEVNTAEQKRQLRRYLAAMQHAVPMVSTLKLALVLYPLVLNAVDYGRGLCLEDAAGKAALQTS